MNEQVEIVRNPWAGPRPRPYVFAELPVGALFRFGHAEAGSPDAALMRKTGPGRCQAFRKAERPEMCLTGKHILAPVEDVLFPDWDGEAAA